MIIDIVCGGVLLLFAIVGLCKGFARQIFKFLSFFAAIIGGFFLVQPVYAWLGEHVEVFAGWETSLASAVGGVEFINNILSKFAEGMGKEVGVLLAEYIMKLGLFIVIAIIVGLLFKLLKKIVFPIADMKVIRVFDRLLGLVYAVAWAAIILGALLLLTDRVLVLHFEPVKTFFEDQLNNGYVVGKYLIGYVRQIGDYLWVFVQSIMSKIA